MYANEFVSGEPIELVIHLGAERLSLFSSFMELVQDNILIKKLEYNGKLLGIPDSCSVDMLYVDPETSRPYIWRDVSLKPVRYKKKVYHCINDFIGEGMPTNRRGAFRLFIGEEMTLYVRDSSGSKRYTVTVKDISETGMCFISSEDFPIKKLVRLDFRDSKLALPLTGHIVRKIPHPERSGHSIYGCRFPEPNPLLGKYIAKRQQEKLQEKLHI